MMVITAVNEDDYYHGNAVQYFDFTDEEFDDYHYNHNCDNWYANSRDNNNDFRNNAAYIFLQIGQML